MTPYAGPPQMNNGQIISTNNLPNNYNTNFNSRPVQPFNSNNNFNNYPPSNPSNNPFFGQPKYNDFSNQPTSNTQGMIMPTIPNPISTNNNPGSIY